MIVKVAQLCPILCHPMVYAVHGILQARTLEWVAFPFSRESSQPRDWTQVSHIAGGFFTSWATREAPKAIYLFLKTVWCVYTCMRIHIIHTHIFNVIEIILWWHSKKCTWSCPCSRHTTLQPQESLEGWVSSILVDIWSLREAHDQEDGRLERWAS